MVFGPNDCDGVDDDDDDDDDGDGDDDDDGRGRCFSASL